VAERQYLPAAPDRVAGAGKSTLGKLVLRFYDPTSGAVLLDGHDLREYCLADPRRNIAVVLQETLVLDGTVRDNIAWARPDATEGDIRRAVLAADAAEFIEALLDEPTTGLDAESAERLLGPVRRLIAGRSTLIISHDPLTAARADRIVVLADGRVAEVGTTPSCSRWAGVTRGSTASTTRSGVPPQLTGVVHTRPRLS
jgi:ATP-binding cassette subfamily B protein